MSRRFIPVWQFSPLGNFLPIIFLQMTCWDYSCLGCRLYVATKKSNKKRPSSNAIKFLIPTMPPWDFRPNVLQKGSVQSSRLQSRSPDWLAWAPWLISLCWLYFLIDWPVSLHSFLGADIESHSCLYHSILGPAAFYISDLTCTCVWLW